MTQSYITYGYKDFFSKTSIVTGIALLFLINYYIIYLYIQNWNIGILPILLVIWLGYIFYSMVRTANGLHYEFSTQGIKIILPNKKSYMLPKEKILSVEVADKYPWWSGQGIWYNFFSKEIMFTTCTKNILRINMDDGRIIIISPRKIDEKLINLYNKKSIKWKK